MMTIRCEVCNQGPEQGVSVYRAKSGAWRCRTHRDLPTAPDLQEVVDVLEEVMPELDRSQP